MQASSSLPPQQLALSDLAIALRRGWETLRHLPGSSLAFSGLFVAIGLALLYLIETMRVAPMALPLAIGFLLVAPILLIGFFSLIRTWEQGQTPSFYQAFMGMIQAPGSLWTIGGICLFLFLIWISDAAVLYAFMIGANPLPYEAPLLIPLKPSVIPFLFWSSLMGLALSFALFIIAGFSIPLLYEGRLSLVAAISASVRAVFKNLFVSLVWGCILAGITLVSILCLPLLFITLPVLAYASFFLYRRVFPPAETA